ncbi:MAG: DNA helicase RecQ [Acidobacterium sp.]|nr:DNA helicase RecQ [Acidobacteriota bacterium]PHY11632.1 MAG: DNA helicase RecQ [Acidobacterium sp.]
MGLLEILEKYWGYSSFRPLQLEAMEAVMADRDSLLVLPTGGGKSLCFQAPAIAREGLAIVVSPLISLMKDQVDTLVGNGVSAAYYNSGMSSEARTEVTRGIRDGRYRMLYVAPERLVGDGGDGFLKLLESNPVSFIAVDEAHCISQWGHDFRTEYRQLARLRERWPSVSMHAYTATATARVRRDIIDQLGLRDAAELVGSFDRPNLVYRVLARATLKAQILDVLGRHRGQAGIIYCTSRKEVDSLSQWLNDTGWRSRPYHAGLPDDERSRNQDAFLNEEVDLVVATVAFGMGIDRSDVRFVIHSGAPQSLEHYQQESGRAGRDGLEAECVLIASGADFLKWRVMLEKNGEMSDARRALLRDMERYAASVGCRHKRLVGYFGEQFTKDDCGACDYCLGELETMADAVTIARKVLSCVARVGQRFGAAHVGNVLRGSDSEQVRSRGHHELSVFGLMTDASIDELRGYIDQLLAHGLLQQGGDEYPILQLTAEGLALLKDAGAQPDLSLARQKRPEKGRLPKRARVETEGWEGVDRELFERLRAMRMQVARKRGVPPYVIFHDTTLREIARTKPETIEELRHVKGVGDRKSADLGELILSIIATP